MTLPAAFAPSFSSHFRFHVHAPDKLKVRRKIDWSTVSITMLVGTAAVIVLVREGPGKFWSILADDALLTLDMMPKVLAGCLLGAFATFLLPREVVMRWIGEESGLMGVVIGTALGVIFPGGPFTIYPVAGALFAVGADIGAVVAFVTSWTLIGYTRVIVYEVPFFGLDFVTWRVIISIPLPLLAGVCARLAGRLWFGAKP